MVGRQAAAVGPVLGGLLILAALAAPLVSPPSAEATGANETNVTLGTNLAWQILQGIYIEFEPATGVATEPHCVSHHITTTRPSDVVPGAVDLLVVQAPYLPGMNLDIPPYVNETIPLAPHQQVIRRDCFGGQGETTVTVGQATIYAKNAFAAKVQWGVPGWPQRDESRVSACRVEEPFRVGFNSSSGKSEVVGHLGTCLDIRPYFDFEGTSGLSPGTSEIRLNSLPSGIPMSIFAGEYGLWLFCADLFGVQLPQNPGLRSIDYAFKFIDGPNGTGSFQHAEYWANVLNWDLKGSSQACEPYPPLPSA